MNYKRYISFLSVLLLYAINLSGQGKELEMVEMNRVCFNCHAHTHYEVFIEMNGVNEKRIMNPYYIIDTMSYMKGVHASFGCIDCHNYEYETYPHKSELKLEPRYQCMDCHGGDDVFAQFHFDEIADEVEESVHAKSFGQSFTCAKCHDPHTYRLVARDSSSNIKDIVRVNNNMCINCHSDLNRYNLYSTNSNPEIVSTHDWLPNQNLHFQSVRCIECHTPINDTMNVPHKILPKESAVRRCVECHSTNSILSNKLYKYKRKQSRVDGFYNDIILNEAYVIGANRNKYLNNISLLIFALTFGGVLIHIVMRIVKRK